MRRLGFILCALALVLAGCGGTQSAAQKQRQAFLFAHPKVNDQELATLCPSLYPSDFRFNGAPKKYGYTKDKKPYVPPPALKAEATRVFHCTATGTKPKGSKLTDSTTATSTTPATTTTSTTSSTTTSTTPASTVPASTKTAPTSTTPAK